MRGMGLDPEAMIQKMRQGVEEEKRKGQTPVEILFYHCDHLGTPLALTDRQGQVAWAAKYDPWGNVEEEFNPRGIEQDIRLPGQHLDRETGLYYNYRRYYDPRIGAYINQDPIGLAGGVNLYGYVVGDPVNLIDPEGLQSASIKNTTQTQLMCNAAGLPAWCPKPPSPIQDAIDDFLRNYKDMRDANTINGDKYFHCKANCEATRRGPEGEKMACIISDGREWVDQNIKRDPPQASVDDQAANAYGRAAGKYTTSLSCSDACRVYRPNGLPSRY